MSDEPGQRIESIGRTVALATTPGQVAGDDLIGVPTIDTGPDKLETHLELGPAGTYRGQLYLATASASL